MSNTPLSQIPRATIYKAEQLEAGKQSLPGVSVPSPDILQAQASTNQSAAATNEAQQRIIAKHQEMAQWMERAVDQRLAEIQAAELRVGREREQVEALTKKANEDSQLASQYKDAALADRSKADEARAHAELCKTEAQHLSDKASAEKAEAVKTLAEAQQFRAQADAASAWPPPLDAREWGDWRNDLRAQLASDWRSALLLSRFQVVASLLRSPEFDKAVFLALYDLGQSVCTVAPQKAKELAEALSQVSGGEFTLELPRLNDTVDRVLMKAPNSTSRVSRVLGWCVKDKLGTVQYHAPVD